MRTFLSISDDIGSVEVANNCRTLAYIENLRPAGWQPSGRHRCPQCCCPSFDDGDYTEPGDFQGNPAPWADASIPASLEAFGWLLDHDGIDIEDSFSTRRASEGGPVLITLTGSLISSTDRGHDYLRRWIRDRLASEGCDGVTLNLFEHCDGLDDPATDCACEESLCCCRDDLPADLFDAAGVILPEYADLACGCLDADGRLAACQYEVEAIDRDDETPVEECPVVAPCGTGARRILGVRLRSFDVLDDGTAGLHCEGGRYVAVLEVADPRMTGCRITACRTPQDWDPDWCEPAPVEPTTFETDPCQTCGVPCRCQEPVEILNVGSVLPLPVAGTEEPAIVTALEPKPVIEPPPPDCDPLFQCAINAFGVGSISLSTGFVDLGAAGFPTPPFPFGTGPPPTVWEADVSLNPAWLNSFVSYLECIGTTFQSEDAGDNQTLQEFAAASSATSVDIFFFSEGVHFAAGVNADGTATVADIVGFDFDSFPGGAESSGPAFTTEQMDCLIGQTCIKPLYQNAEIGDFIYPFPLIYNGVLYSSGPDFAAGLAAERNCPVTWNDEFHPTDPCSYCIPNDCPRQTIPNLELPPVCVRPLIDGEETTGPIDFPMIYGGVELASGIELAEFLSATRGCEITWENDTYCLPPDCPRGQTVNLQTPTLALEDECFSSPTEVIRQACLIPGSPKGIDREAIIRLVNGAGPIENASIRIWEWVPNLPHILNPTLGGPAYWAGEPIAEYDISGMPAFSTLIIDGVSNEVGVCCGQLEGGAVSGPDNSPAQPARIGCGCYWVELLLSCDPAVDGSGQAYGALDAVLEVETIGMTGL